MICYIAPEYGQHIQLIGHSRGAAVNALVSDILSSSPFNYTIDDYISLDATTTDWPNPSDILGDISIDDTATATTKINYEVQEGLATTLDQWLDEGLGVSLTPTDIADLDAATSWKRPIALASNRIP